MSFVETKVFSFFAHLIAPPLASWVAIKKNPDTIKDTVETKIHLNSFRGALLGFIVGLLAIKLPLILNVLIPDFLPFSFGFLIPIPWFTSAIGKGFGVLYGINKTLRGLRPNGPSSFRLFMSTVLFGNTAYVRRGFYSYFFEVPEWGPPEYNMSEYKNKYKTPIRALLLDIMLQNGEVDPQNLSNLEPSFKRFTQVIKNAFLHTIRNGQKPYKINSFFDENKVWTFIKHPDPDDRFKYDSKKNRDKKIYHQTIMNYYGGYIAEVQKQVNSLSQNDIDPAPFLDIIINTPKIIPQLIELKVLSQEHFEQYQEKILKNSNDIIRTYSKNIFADVVEHWIDLENYLNTNQFSKEGHRLILKYVLSENSPYWRISNEHTKIKQYIQLVKKLQKTQAFSSTNLDYLLKNPDSVEFIHDLDLAPIEESTYECAGLEQKEEQTNYINREAEQNKFIFVTSILDEYSNVSKYVDVINEIIPIIKELNSSPQGREAWDYYYKKWSSANPKPHINEIFYVLQSLNFLAKNNQGIESCELLLSHVKEDNQAIDAILFAYILILLPTPQEKLHHEATRIWDAFKQNNKGIKIAAYKIAFSELFVFNQSWSDISQYPKVRENRISYVLKDPKAVSQALYYANRLFEGNHISQRTCQWAFDRLFLAQSQGRLIIPCLRSLFPLVCYSAPEVIIADRSFDQTLRTFLNNTLYAENLEPLFTTHKEVFLRIPFDLRLNLIHKIIQNGTHATRLKDALGYQNNIEAESAIRIIEDVLNEELPTRLYHPPLISSEAKAAVLELEVAAKLEQRAIRSEQKGYALGLFRPTTDIGDLKVFTGIEEFLTPETVSVSSEAKSI